MDADDELQPSAPGVPPGFPEPQPRWMSDSWSYSEPQGWQPRRPNQWNNYTEFKPDLRNWKTAPLDLTAMQPAFLAWQARAACVLSTNRPDVRRLLDWAVSCKTPIDASAAQKGALQADLCQWDDVTGVSVTLLDTMMHMIADSLIHDTKICGEGHGFELWRSLNARWHGRSDQVLQATLRAYITPTRCSRLLHTAPAVGRTSVLGAEGGGAGLGKSTSL